jgi:aspartate beta-hydroxylase
MASQEEAIPGEPQAIVNNPPVTETEARALADAINQVSATLSPDEALKMVEAAVTRAPGQAMVLNAAGGHMMRSGDARRAREYFERAIAVDGKSKVLWLNLAGACRSLDDKGAEGQALEKALLVDPRYVQALLQKGDLLERLANPKAAAALYNAALASVASGVQVPQSVAPAIARARQFVSDNKRELEQFLEREVSEARARQAGTDLHRFDACRDVFLGKRPVYINQPRGIMFPYLPAIEFFRREEFPWLAELEAATDDIAAEALAALEEHRREFRPYVDFPDSVPVDQWAPLNRSMDWSIYSLWHDGVPVAEHQRKCPKTTAALAKVPMCDIPGYAPGAYFSVLQPHTHLPAHTGTTNSRSIVHLPLVIPDGCRFRVGSQTRPWKKGEAWVFDDSIDHEAWNDADRLRIVLIFDIWNPLLSAAERDLLSAFTIGVGRYYGDDAPQLASR